MVRSDLVRYTIKRLLLVIPVWLGISIVSFAMMHLAPGSPEDTILPEGTATPERVAYVREQWGLDQPVYMQYFDWLANVARGDFGESFVRGTDVTGVVVQSIYPSLQLALLATFFAVVIAVTLGTIAAVNKGGWIDQGSRVLAFSFVAMPRFWFGLMLILIFGQFWAGWFGYGLIATIGFASPRDGIVPFLRHAVAPALAAGVVYMGILMRITRGAVVEELNKQYVQTARTKGVPERIVIGVHVLRNAMIPVITVAGLQLGGLLGGLVVIESVFAIPGLGRLLFQSVYDQDIPMVQAILILIGTFYVMTNLVVDLLYAYLDPRITY